ncbi:hypothetical protein PZA22_11585 [Pectobacterium polaris]|uniref:hypothetical protein n=1 Tax=Pectobacterium TaxID=122277 RepID=UPI00192A549C|nr:MULTISPECIES: hypothetical protein [Pectobacterium]MDE8755128.1 hypothetical protein [Pectobacterium polaris]
MAKKKFTTISHKSTNYELEYGGWHNHLYGDGVKALFEVFTDDVRLSDSITVGEYKALKNEEYRALPDTSCITFSKYLRCSFKEETGKEWDDCITLLKKRINDHATPYILRHKENVSVDERSKALLKAASNGHVASMYFIGTALKDGGDDNCLTWLSMAHNRGHVGASYDIAAYLDRVGNTLDSLRCLIIAADGGADLAYMGIFHINILMKFLKIQDVVSLDRMLDELISGSHNTCARYFKAIRLLSGTTPADGIELMRSFRQGPKKKPADELINETYYKHLDFTHEYVDLVLVDIAASEDPLNSIIARSVEFSDANRFQRGRAAAASFADFDDVCILMRDKLGQTVA